jgi:hypothetical protein
MDIGLIVNVMERHHVIQRLIDKNRFTTYLEIGVRDGNVFFSIKCKTKIAVDPDFAFTSKEKIKQKVYSLSGSSFFEITSDDFFLKYAPGIFQKRKLDIVLVDGMHEFDYVNKDILNSLNNLSDNGFIVVHDCNPVTVEAACSFEEWKARGFAGIWNGDVWKSVTWLNKTRPDLDVFVADCDYGLGIIKKAKALRRIGNNELYTPDYFRKLTYNDFMNFREDYLNLKPIEYLERFLNEAH